MSDETMINGLYATLYPLLKEDHEATAFCVDMMKICQTWDDLIDQDSPYSNEDINQVFHILLFELPTNPFYVRYQAELRPLIMSSILKWYDANEMEAGKDDNDLNMAYMLRADIYSIFCHVAYLVGGLSHARQFGLTIRRIYCEKLEDFKKEVNHA